MKKASRHTVRRRTKPSPKGASASSNKPVEQVLTSPPPSSVPIQRILVPIDFSAHSKNALRHAIPFAEQFGASLHLVYVVEPTVYPADLGFGQVVMPDVEEELRERGFEELKGLIEREIGDRVRATSTVRTGKPHQEILREAEEHHVDLIVLATHGHTGVEQILFGSTAMRVVRLAKCPVLTVRPEVERS